MKQIPLGQTGIDVSALCLGCMFFGTLTAREMAYQLADRYFEAGGRFFDTANNYAFWIDGATGDESETVLGRWLKSRKNRDQIILATKVGARPGRPGGGFESWEGLSARAIEQAVEGSLTRLGTDYLDLYYAHIDDRQTPLEETLAAFDRLVTAGKVRAIGCSNLMAWRIEQARSISRLHDWAAYCCVQQRYSYLQPRPKATFETQIVASQELLDYCQIHKDFSLLAYSPLLSGAYTRQDVALPPQYRSSDTEARLGALATVAAETGATANQIVLAWLLQDTPSVIPVIAASNKTQLDENLGTLQVHLTEEHMRTLNSPDL
ncbi:aldo/keto reductase [Reticulibacter mediterranei]|uniref:Aldo/keto reductase n=1 Tax=Reticulibacter mediterranei TaxID=2778369 RepID=A0A8J3IWD2_9CHLR|nr:aldo/keto reductase [Reticulibacter mediterranei]GHO99079.1 aldo/keto reductase [Reticulibacter mediterranei]